MTRLDELRRAEIIAEAIRVAAEATGWSDADLVIDAAAEATGAGETEVRRIYDQRFRVWGAV